MLDLTALIDGALQKDDYKLQELCEYFDQLENSEFASSVELSNLKRHYKNRIFESLANDIKDPLVLFLRGFYYQYLDIPSNLVNAASYYSKAELLGFSYAMLGLGHIEFQYGEKEKAEEWFRKSAERNNACAMFKLGRILLRSNKEKNILSAVDYFEKAASLNHSRAMCALAKIYHKGLTGDPVNFEKTLALYEKAIVLKNPNAMIYRARMYLKAQGSSRNYIAAAKLYREAYGYYSYGVLDNTINVPNELLLLCKKSNLHEVHYQYALAINSTSVLLKLAQDEMINTADLIIEDTLISNDRKIELLSMISKNLIKENNKKFEENDVVMLAKKSFEIKATDFAIAILQSVTNLPKKKESSLLLGKYVYRQSLSRGLTYQQALRKAESFTEETIDEKNEKQDISADKLFSLLGDGRNGNKFITKKPKLNKKNLHSVLSTYGQPLDRLSALEQAFEYIIDSTNKAYTRKNNCYKLGCFLKIRTDITLSATQKNHIGLLKQVYIDVVRKNINDPIIRQRALQKSGLIDFNRTYYQRFIKETTTSRELINDLLFENGFAPSKIELIG